MVSASPFRPTADALRVLAMDAVQKANCGHPGLPMGMADAATVLWSRFLSFDPQHPDWPGRDRFVLSAGHGSMLLYGLLHLSGFDLSSDDLRAFRQLGSRTPGHPERGRTAGVETTTGPLGQGFANAVGMALGARMAAERFDCPALHTRTFVIASDGDLMEGICHEAASLAGHLGLDRLVVLYDDNQITIEGETSLAFSEDVPARFTALGWRVITTDGHDFEAVESALEQAVAVTDKPVLVVCRTHIAYGSPGKQDTADAHGAPLGAAEVAATKAALGLPPEAFALPRNAGVSLREAAARGAAARRAWEEDMARWRTVDDGRTAILDAFLQRRAPEDLFARLAAAVEGSAGATRALSGAVIQAAAAAMPSLVGGSADLGPSCKTGITNSTSVAAGAFAGRNLHFGVREHAMGAVLNGLTLWGGYTPIGSTFLVFADYMRPAIRLAAVMGIHSTFVFTHDSLMVGEDGPTHQPVEQLAALRVIPGLHVWRPADGVEVAAAWTATLTRRDGPTALCLTRQGLPALERNGSPADALRGGYVVQDAPDAVATVIASGSEVSLAVAAAGLLAAKGTPVRVVSMPCLEVFHSQDPSWRELVLGTVPRCAVEMGVPDSLAPLVGGTERVIGVDRFGASGSAAAIAQAYGFTPRAIAQRISALLLGGTN